MDTLPNDVLWIILREVVLDDLETRYPRSFNRNATSTLKIMRHYSWDEALKIYELSQVCKSFRKILKKKSKRNNSSPAQFIIRI